MFNNSFQYLQSLLQKQTLQLVRRNIPPRTTPETGSLHPQNATDRQINSGLAPYNGEWTHTQVVHLLKRTTFGASKQHIETLLNLTLPEAVSLLLYSECPVPPPPINTYNGIDDPPIVDPTIPLGETWVNAPYTDEVRVVVGRFISLKMWWVENMLYQPLHITEKMILFWHNHFATQASQLFEPRFTYRHLSMLRQYALGNVRQMAHAVTIDPQMLVYLNGAFNVATAPDENYARELQELFCIGKGSGSAYTENDVQTAARALTGWTVSDLDTFQPIFIPFLHDTNNKQFSSFYNNTVIEGQAGSAGENELDALLDMLFATEECAKFICRELYRFFVYHQIDANTEANVIEPLAQILRSNNYEILPTLEALLLSEHFFDPLNRAVVIKSPLDYVIGLMREGGVDTPPPPYYNENWALGSSIISFLGDLQQDPGDPPNVAGWYAYYQAPQFDKLWISSVTLTNRLALIDVLLFVGIMYGDNQSVKFDAISYTQTLDNPNDPNALIAEAARQLCIYDLSDEVIQHLKGILLDNQTSDYYWTLAWEYFLANPTNTDAIALINYRLSSMYQYLLHQEEYQLA